MADKRDPTGCDWEIPLPARESTLFQVIIDIRFRRKRTLLYPRRGGRGLHRQNLKGEKGAKSLMDYRLRRGRELSRIIDPQTSRET